MGQKPGNSVYISRLQNIQKIWSSMKVWTLPVSMLLICLIASGFGAGCSNSDTSPITYFPVQKEVLEVYPALGIHGVLFLENGVLRIKARDETDYAVLPVWSYGYNYRTEEGKIFLYDGDGQLVARTGDMIVVGGAVIHTEMVNKLATPPVPEDVPGPYWLASPGGRNETLELEKARKKLGLPEPQ